VKLNLTFNSNLQRGGLVKKKMTEKKGTLDKVDSSAVELAPQLFEEGVNQREWAMSRIFLRRMVFLRSGRFTHPAAVEPPFKAGLRRFSSVCCSSKRPVASQLTIDVAGRSNQVILRSRF
jgi:hypothetical protein